MFFTGLAVLVFFIPLIIIGGVIYLIFQKRGEREVDWVQIYFQLASLLLLMVVWWGAADLGRMFLKKAFVPETQIYQGDKYYPVNYDSQDRFQNQPADLERFARQLSIRVAALLVTLPLFIYHFSQARRRGVHKIYYAFISLLTGTTAVIALVLVVRALIEALVGLELDRELLTEALPYLLVSSLIWLFHLREFQFNRDLNRPPALPHPAGTNPGG